MGYVDMAIGTAFFLFFLAVVLLITIQHFVRYPTMVTIEEYREKAVNLFSRFFATMGIPYDWEETGIAPSELGLIVSLYVKPVLVKELGVAARQNEPIVVNLIFDEECKNKTWNNTVRVYDSNLTKIEYEFVNPVFCSEQFLNESYVRFNVNISQNGEKTYFVYYYDDESIPAPNYTMLYSTPSWVPVDGDSWSESTTSWYRYGGSTGSAETNSIIKMKGSSSIQINGTFDNETLGLRYDPASLMTGVSNGWYIDAWIYLDTLSGISAINVSVSDSSDVITTSIDANSLADNEWYHFERELNSTKWESWGTFNASDGIDNISFYMLNSTPDIIRQLKIDELHFELKPLDVKIFPEEVENIVSSRKISALGNLTYEELREIIGEEYRFRIEIVED